MQRQNQSGCFDRKIGIWCNGNTADSGPAFPGSSPGIPTALKSKLNFSTWIFCFILLPYYNSPQKGKQLKQQVRYITEHKKQLKGEQQITTQQDRKAAPTLLSFF